MIRYKIIRFIERVFEHRVSADPSEWVYFLHEAIQALHRSRGYIQSRTRYENISQKKTLDASIRNLLLASELARKIPLKVRDANPEIQWERIFGYNRFLHFRYTPNDFETIWREANEELPSMIAQLMKMRDETGFMPDPPSKARKKSTS